jgi:hypothetical protein
MRTSTLGQVSIAFGKRRTKAPKIAHQKRPMQITILQKARTTTMRNSLLLPCILTRTVPTDSNSNLYHIPLIREFPANFFLDKVQCLTSYSPMTFDPNFPMIAVEEKKKKETTYHGLKTQMCLESMPPVPHPGIRLRVGSDDVAICVVSSTVVGVIYL